MSYTRKLKRDIHRATESNKARRKRLRLEAYRRFCSKG